MSAVAFGQQSAYSVSGTFTGTGFSNPVRSHGNLFAHLQGTFSATVKVQFSPDNGTTWFTLQKDDAGNDIVFIGPVSVPLFPNHNGSLWRLQCSAYTSGSIVYVLAGG